MLPTSPNGPAANPRSPSTTPRRSKRCSSKLGLAATGLAVALLVGACAEGEADYLDNENPVGELDEPSSTLLDTDDTSPQSQQGLDDDIDVDD